jgi:hypothetical protein
MKENKYKEMKGFENLNTFVQFDQFETQRIHGGKNRFVYDFSFQTRNGFPDNYIFDDTYYTTFYNIGPTGYRNPSQLVNQYGFPGGFCEFVSVEDSAQNNTVVPLTWGNYEQTVNEDEKTFYFNEKTIGYTDTASQSALGGAQLANWNDVFRSGYVEFTIKSNKKNMVICAGSEEIKVNDLNAIFWIFGADVENGTSVTEVAIADTKISNKLVEIEDNKYVSQSFDKALFNLDIRLENGRVVVDYENAYDQNNTSFSFHGNKDVADNQWHHVVVNFGRPGLITSQNKKLNKRTVEIWVDGNLDKQFDEKVNDFQIFYPSLVWLFNSPSKMIKDFFNSADIENSTDYQPRMSQDPGGIVWAGVGTSFLGYDEFLDNRNIYVTQLSSPSSIERGFKGAMHTYAHGHNVPLNKKEIQNRYRLWQRQTKKIHKAFNVNANMVTPTVQTNAKKALKLYWDDLSYSSKFGVELDNNIVVHNYSVINKTSNSKTEIFNLDKSNPCDAKILTNVRVALTSHVITHGPGKLTANNKRGAAGQGTLGGGNVSQYVPSSNNGLQTLVLDETIIADLYFSGIELNVGDRILLTRQIDDSENGIWTYNGKGSALTRPSDAFVSDNTKTYIVYVTDGINKDSYWKATQYISSFNDSQRWSMISLGNPDYANIDPENITRWKDYFGNDRLINLEEDVDINDFDLIVFMNYPVNNEELFSHFPNDPQALVVKQYNDFLKSIQNVVANGASLMVTSPKLAEDLGIVKEYEQISQFAQQSDAQAAAIDPFEVNGDPARYFDTHRNNKYSLATAVPGLTNRETYVLVDFVNYVPENAYDYDEYHAKYSYRQFGLAEGNEFIIPGTALRAITNNENIPGYRNNYRGSDVIWAVKPSNVVTGTVVTQLANTYYNGSTAVNNPYDDYATTIIVHNGQLLNGQPINGKIFINCTEDSYAFSRKEYNKAMVQIVNPSDPYETIGSLNWQYSTKRLNRSPQRVNVSGLTELGQTTPTNGGGGAFIQATSNSSNGIIRSETDFGNIDYQSDLYATESEEIYPIQEIPVLSMTWLGLKWLEG